MSGASVVAVFERVSKAALATSVFAIVLVLLFTHPDLTPLIQGAGAIALGLGFLSGGLGAVGTAAWVAAAPVAPALLRALTGREGPVLDLIWMAGLAGALLPATSWSRWHVPPVWRLLLGGWALTMSLAWPIVVGRELGFDWRTFSDAGAINSWAMLSAPQVVAWTLYVCLTQLLALLWLDWLAGQFAASPGRTPRAMHALWLGVTAASVVAVYQGTVDLSFLSTGTWAGLRRATGTLLDANGYGVLAALAAPVAFLALRAGGNARGRAAAAIVLAVNWLGLWMSGSRTALVCGLAGAVGLAAGFARSAGPGRARWRPAQLAGLGIVLGIIVAAGAIGPLRRIAEVPLSREGVSELWRRGGYGTVAVQMVRDYPWTGVGPGAFHVLAPDYWRVMHDVALPFDNAQNWWRHQLAELGLLGATPLLVWSLVLAISLLRAPRQDRFAEAWAARALLAGIGIASMLGVPTQNPVVLLWFVSLAAWWTATRSGARPAGEVTPAWMAPVAAVLLALSLAHATGTALLARGALSVPERAARAHRDYAFGAYGTEQAAGTTAEFHWTDDESRFIWAAETDWLVLRLWVLHPDAAARPVHVTVETRCQVLFERELDSSSRVSVGMTLPAGRPPVDVTVRASRTWQPSAFGSADTRKLGAGVMAAFVHSRADAEAQTKYVDLRACP